MTIFVYFPPTSSHLHPLQVENCDSNSRLVVDEDDNGKGLKELVLVHHLRGLSNLGLKSGVFEVGRCSQLLKYAGQCGPQNATVAPGHSTMTYHPTSTVISQDNNTIIMRFIPIAALRASSQVIYTLYT